MGVSVGAATAMHFNSIETARWRYIWWELDAGFVASSKGFGDWDEEEGEALSLV